MISRMRILLIDDDVELTALLAQYLRQDGFDIAEAQDGEQGLAMIRTQHFDLAVLDVMMPGKGGMEVLRELRAFSNLPVIMLTARGEEADRIIGLELGADDYLPKPCNPRELAARIRAVLRRSGDGPERPKAQRIGAFVWQPGARRIFEHDRELPLTATEYDIMACLLAHAGEVVRKDVLSREALGKRLGPFDRALDVHIGRIRRKLSSQDSPIVTVRGVGWMLRVDV